MLYRLILTRSPNAISMDKTPFKLKGKVHVFISNKTLPVGLTLVYMLLQKL